jgi:hypothetical protein
MLLLPEGKNRLAWSASSHHELLVLLVLFLKTDGPFTGAKGLRGYYLLGRINSCDLGGRGVSPILYISIRILAEPLVIPAGPAMVYIKTKTLGARALIL